jgi:hypothetical protein
MAKSEIDVWVDFAQNFTLPDVFGRHRHLSPRQWYFRFNLPLAYAELPLLYWPPLSISPSYIPTLSVTWTTPGALLSFTPAIPSGCAIFVRQTRNLRACNIRPVRGPVSHIFFCTDTSPQLISPPAADGGGPKDQPPFNSKSYIHVHCLSLDDWGRSGIEQFTALQVG